MIYITAIIKAKVEYREEVSKALQHMVTKTREEKACIQYDLHQGQDDENTFIFYEIWKDQEGLDKHNKQPYILAFGELAQEKLQENPQIYLTDKI
ncbi:putative quinol monooxygenase [Sphingobacterium arenae]|uniref:Antibiotic biosynthesis monooxygenase n=1 Tax=Sphingobacterium arenae TaxID=1280598 RepID=A0ABR7Y9J9_9SPHI|nr:putative quinol monooxygenase [Sphingobacterium arenae]MBD1427918.1 antibiotic biosynthesis monooxygenase [Sphingobacterium arenae]